MQLNGLRKVMINMTNIFDKLDPWLRNPPDYYETKQAYMKLGQCKALIKRKEREISRAEELITAEIDRPRSNEAKVAKLKATATMKDELAELEAEFAVVESEVKALEFMKSMFSSAMYRMKMQNELG